MAKAKKKKTITVKRCNEMFTDEVSVVTRGANGHDSFLMLKSDGELGRIVDDDEYQLPCDDATDDEKTKARMERSRKYGIEIDPSKTLDRSDGDPTNEGLFGDSVNLEYPLAKNGETKPNVEITQRAIEQFRKSFGSYDSSSGSRVFERIVRAAMSTEIEVSLDPNSEADNLLPTDIKKILKKNANGPDTEPESTDSNTDENDVVENNLDWIDRVEKTLDGSDQDDWMDGVQSTIDSVNGSQGTESVQKGDGESDSAAGSGNAVPRETAVESGASITIEALETLKKESTRKDETIEKLRKSIIGLKADVSRLKTSIGSGNAMRPGENGGPVKRDPVDELNSCIDLSPALE